MIISWAKNKSIYWYFDISPTPLSHLMLRRFANVVASRIKAFNFFFSPPSDFNALIKWKFFTTAWKFSSLYGRFGCVSEMTFSSRVFVSHGKFQWVNFSTFSFSWKSILFLSFSHSEIHTAIQDECWCIVLQIA